MRINSDIPNDLYKRFKQAINDRFDGKKGDMTKALIDALELWIKTKPTTTKPTATPSQKKT